MHDESHPVFFAYRLPKDKNIIPISTSAVSYTHLDVYKRQVRMIHHKDIWTCIRMP